MTAHTPPDDDFDNALAVFGHDIRAVMPAWGVQYLTDEIRRVHAEMPELDFADAAAIARTRMTAR